MVIIPPDDCSDGHTDAHHVAGIWEKSGDLAVRPLATDDAIDWQAKPSALPMDDFEAALESGRVGYLTKQFTRPLPGQFAPSLEGVREARQKAEERLLAASARNTHISATTNWPTRPRNSRDLLDSIDMAKKPSTDTLVLFVRHGRTPTTGQVLPGRTKGLHLSDIGQQQAKEVAVRITESIKSIDAIYTSPLERCRETAAPLARETGLRAVAEKGLLECDFGDWTGAELKKLHKLPEWKSLQTTPSQFRFPNGESFLEMQARVSSAVARIHTEHPGKTVVLFSHADPIKAALMSAMGTPLDMFQRISVSPCSVSAVLYGSSTPAVLTVNAVDNLGTLQPS